MLNMKGRLLLSAMLAVTLSTETLGGTAEETKGQGKGMPVTGSAASGMASFDRLLPELMRKWDIPGAAVAVSVHGRLVFARGYGWADREKGEAVQPDSLFRIASLSKPITAVAILKLVEEGKLSLDDKAFRILNHLQPPPGAQVDKRIYGITIRHLLQHTGGWHRDLTFDPMFHSPEIARAMGVPEPPGPQTIVRYMLGQPLQFDPGTRYAYSNFGYCVLGRVIEKVSGLSYEEYVKTRVLAWARITAMRLGRTLPKDRAPKEVRYYGYPGQPLVRSVFPSLNDRVPSAYGGWYLEAMDAHGGWLASAVDLLRFVTAIDGRETGSGTRTRRDILRRETLRLITAKPSPYVSNSESRWYGLGWGVTEQPRGFRLMHSGGMSGTATVLTNGWSGVAWALLFNSRPLDQEKLLDEAQETIWQAAREVTSWPSDDLFPSFDEIMILGGLPGQRKKQ
jgi:N-acyl-D-amino-acid deacylase